MLSPQRLRAKPMIYKRCHVYIKEDFKAPLSPKLLKYVSFLEVHDETLSLEEDDRLQGPMKKFAAYVRKFRKVKGMVVKTQQMWYEADDGHISGAFKLFTKAFDGSAMKKLDLSIQWEEDSSFAFTEERWLHVVIGFVIKMKNLKKLTIDFDNFYYGQGLYGDKVLRMRLLRRLRLLEKLETIWLKSRSGGIKKKEFELVLKKLPKVKSLCLDFEEEEDDEGEDGGNEADEDDKEEKSGDDDDDDDDE